MVMHNSIVINGTNNDNARLILISQWVSLLMDQRSPMKHVAKFYGRLWSISNVLGA